MRRSVTNPPATTERDLAEYRRGAEKQASVDILTKKIRMMTIVSGASRLSRRSRKLRMPDQRREGARLRDGSGFCLSQNSLLSPPPKASALRRPQRAALRIETLTLTGSGAPAHAHAKHEIAAVRGFR